MQERDSSGQRPSHPSGARCLGDMTDGKTTRIHPDTSGKNSENSMDGREMIDQGVTITANPGRTSTTSVALQTTTHEEAYLSLDKCSRGFLDGVVVEGNSSTVFVAFVGGDEYWLRGKKKKTRIMNSRGA